MSKDVSEHEHRSAEGPASSEPPRGGASVSPRRLPSTPPSTEEIDTDWGTDPEPLAAKSAAPQSAPVHEAIAAAVAPNDTTRSAVAAEPGSPMVGPQRAARPRSATLIGIAPVVQKTAQARPAQPRPGAGERVRPLLARTLIGGLVAPGKSAQTRAGERERTSAASASFQSARVSSNAALTSDPPAGQGSGVHRVLADLGIPLHDSALPSHPADARADPVDNGFRRWLLVLVAALVVVSAVAYRVLRAHRAEPSSTLSAALPRVLAPSASEAPITHPDPSAPTPASASATAPSATDDVRRAASAAAVATNDSAASTNDAPAPGTYRVTIRSVPSKAKFYRFGKQVGVTPFALDLPIGERRTYEAALPGHAARRVIVDGSKPEITVGLRDH